MFDNDIRCKVLDAVDDGMISKDQLLEALLGYMSQDNVHEVLRLNEISLFEEEDEDEDEEE